MNRLKKGIDIGDTIIDPVSKKEFTIVGFTERSNV